MLGHFSPEALRAFAEAHNLDTGNQDFSEGVFDFKSCQKPNGETYGIPKEYDCAPGNKEVSGKPSLGSLSEAEKPEALKFLLTKGVDFFGSMKKPPGEMDFQGEWKNELKRILKEREAKGGTKILSTMSEDPEFKFKATQGTLIWRLGMAETLMKDRQRHLEKFSDTPSVRSHLLELAPRMSSSFNKLVDEVGRYLKTSDPKLAKQIEDTRIRPLYNDILSQYNQSWATIDKLLKTSNTNSDSATRKVDAPAYNSDYFRGGKISMRSPAEDGRQPGYLPNGGGYDSQQAHVDRMSPEEKQIRAQRIYDAAKGREFVPNCGMVTREEARRCIEKENEELRNSPSVGEVIRARIRAGEAGRYNPNNYVPRTANPMDDLHWRQRHGITLRDTFAPPLRR